MKTELKVEPYQRSLVGSGDDLEYLANLIDTHEINGWRLLQVDAGNLIFRRDADLHETPE